MIKNLKPRLYQEIIFNTCINHNSLVVLPTGLGKTIVAVMLIAQRLMQYPNSKAIIFSPTKPLSEQIWRVCRDHLSIEDEKIVLFTGNVSSDKRCEMFKHAQIIISTPQGMENDIINKKITLEDVSLMVFDEAHRAVGDYSYVWIADQYVKYSQFPRILALTASPGSEMEKIQEILKNLSIEEIEARTEEDEDVMPYVKEVNVRWVYVELPEELVKVKVYLDRCIKSKIDQISNFGLLDKRFDYASKKSILELQGHLQSELAQGNREFDVLKSVSLASEIIKVHHALELLESQGVKPLLTYLKGIESKAATSQIKAVQNLVKDLNFRSALFLAEKLGRDNIEHPKLIKLKELLEECKQKKIMIFTQYRDTGKEIVEVINGLDGINSKLFVGQAKKNETGLTQKEQIEMLEQFRNDEFNVLVSSSIGEEGLDIPQVDAVIFFEPIPSAIRHIQRRGRTGRQDKGEIIIFATKGTRDIGYKWSAYHKEKRMHRLLKELRNTIKLSGTRKTIQRDVQRDMQKDITSFEKKLILYADHREKTSHLIKEMINKGIDVRLVHLNSGDYVLSPDVGVEFKTQEDFITSLLDGRLFEQLTQLKQNYKKPLLIVEGNQDLYSIRNVHPNAVNGLLSTIVIGYSIPLLQTKNQQETINFIHTMLKQEQEKLTGSFSPHFEKRSTSIKEQQEYIVSSLPGVGPVLAKPLLHKFKTIKNIINSSIDELKEVKLIGEKKANTLNNIINEEYKP